MSILSVAAATVGKIFGKKVISEQAIGIILDTVAKKLPMSEGDKAELETELAQLGVKELQAKKRYIKGLGRTIRDGIIPAIIAEWGIMYGLLFLSDFWHLCIRHQEAPIVVIPSDFTETVWVMVGFVFSYKTAKRYAPGQKGRE